LIAYKYIDIRSILDKYQCVVEGDTEDIAFESIASFDLTSEGSIDWCANEKIEYVQEYVNKSLSKTVIINLSLLNQVKNKDKVLIFVSDPKAVISDIAKKLFLRKDFLPRFNEDYSISDHAKIGNNVTVGKYCIIGDAKIEENSILYGSNYIASNTEIGKNVIIYFGAVIGGPGFGFVKDKLNNSVRFAHIGKVIIKDYVEIGANTVIDRGGFGSTIIGEYTKIDSMVHIGHNVKIGRRCIICSNTTISGSVTISDDVWIGPNSVIKEHLEIVGNSFVGIGSVVVNSILRPKKVFGNPAKELRF